jgi:hypothetical protein
VDLYPVVDVSSISRRLMLLWANAVDVSPRESTTDASNFRAALIGKCPISETTPRIWAGPHPIVDSSESIGLMRVLVYTAVPVLHLSMIPRAGFERELLSCGGDGRSGDCQQFSPDTPRASLWPLRGREDLCKCKNIVKPEGLRGISGKIIVSFPVSQPLSQQLRKLKASLRTQRTKDDSDGSHCHATGHNQSCRSDCPS